MELYCLSYTQVSLSILLLARAPGKLLNAPNLSGQNRSMQLTMLVGFRSYPCDLKIKKNACNVSLAAVDALLLARNLLAQTHGSSRAKMLCLSGQ